MSCFPHLFLSPLILCFLPFTFSFSFTEELWRMMSFPIGLALLSSLSSLFLHKNKIKKLLQCDECSGGDASHCIFSFLFAFSFLLLILISFPLHVFLLFSDRLYGFLFMTSLDLNDNELEK